MKLSLAREKEIHSILSRQGRKKSGKMVVEGIRAIKAMLHSRVQPEYFVVSSGRLTSEGRQFLEEIQRTAFPLIECDARRFNKLSDTVRSQGFLAVVRRGEKDIDDGIWQRARFVVFLDGVNDPGNLGTIVRLAVAFHVDLLALSSDSVDITNPKAVRASAGYLFTLPILRVRRSDTFFDQVESNGLTIFGASGEGEREMEETEFGNKTCLVIGSEARGIRESVMSRCQGFFRIRTLSEVESLNAAAAGAIAMHYIARKLELL